MVLVMVGNFDKKEDVQLKIRRDAISAAFYFVFCFNVQYVYKCTTYHEST